jgi:hypothetical protein
MILFKNCKYIFNQPPIFVKISNGMPWQLQHLGRKNATVMHLLLRRHKVIIGLFSHQLSDITAKGKENGCYTKNK